QPAAHFDADKFLKALKSNDLEHIYIAIHRLVETFNDQIGREKALQELQPYAEHDNQKIADAAVFAIDILTKRYESPYIVHLADGSKLFTMFNNYSDYGSQNVLWRIKDDMLEKYRSFTLPSMYVTAIIPSPNQQLIAVVTVS